MVKLSNLLIKKSGIAGKGVYTKIPIKKGTTVCFMKGEIIDLDTMSQRVDDNLEKGSDPLEIDDEMYIDMEELPRTINHCCEPNCCIVGKNKLISIKNIKKDEELTYDYSTTMNDNEEKIKKSGGSLWTIKCRCGAKNCRGIIDQFKTLPKKRREFYLKNKYAPDFILREFG